MLQLTSFHFRSFICLNLQRLALLITAGVVILSSGCKGDIGAECITSAQCQTGQVCDLISEGGYCTITPCEPGGCPESSICVIFENEDRYCMATCSQNEDCRDGYICDRESATESFCRQAP